MATVGRMSESAVIQLPTPSRIPVWTWADRLRKVRRDANLTQEEFATNIGVTRQAFAAWEAGRSIPGDVAGVAVRLERATGVPRAWFLGWMDAESPSPDGGGASASLSQRARPEGLEPPTFCSVSPDPLTSGDTLAPVIPLPVREHLDDVDDVEGWLAPVTALPAAIAR